MVASVDLLVVRTLSFKLLYGLVILRHARSRIVSIAVTTDPTAQWIAGHVTDAFRGMKRRGIRYTTALNLILHQQLMVVPLEKLKPLHIDDASHRPLHYHTPTRASSRIRFSGGEVF